LHFKAIAAGCGDATQDIYITLPSTIPTVTLAGGAADPVTALVPVTVGYTFPMSRFSGRLPQITSPYTECTADNLPPSGSYQCIISTACWATGEHDITATGVNCSGDVSQVAHTTVTVNSKPTVTLNSNNQDGVITFTVGWGFPNTLSSQDRVVTVVRDGCCTDFRSYQGPVNQQDSAPFTIDTRCWPKGTHTWVATATNICVNPNESATAQQSVDVQGGTAAVGITLVGNGQTPAGDPSYDLTVSWDFPSNTTLPQRSVVVTCDTGNCPSIPAIVADPAKNSKTFTIGALDGYTHFTATATNSRCSPALTEKAGAGAGGCCPAGSAGKPVLVNIGSVQADDTDPLPQQSVLHLSRAYDSDNRVTGLFGTGWTSLLDSHLTFAPSAGSQVVAVTLESHTQYLFWVVGGQYRQLWPKGQQVMATLSGNTSSGFVFREAASQMTRTFSGTGKLLNVTSLRDGRVITISYDGNGLPTTIADSWQTFSFAVTTDSTDRLITKIQVNDDISWTYQYSSTTLTGVLAPDGQPWRTYVYDGSGHLTEVHDALGNLVESHAYDANGRGTNSLQASDDVGSISFGQGGRVAGETITQVTYTSGRVVNYYVRGTSGVLHTVEVRGGCSTCSQDEDVTYTFDASNHVIREQNGRGYVRESAYDFNTGQLRSVTGPLKPGACDPQNDAGHCRMTTDDLAAATLAATSLTKTTTYVYGNTTWPDFPTSITTTSVANPSDTKTESFTYDATTGVPLTHSETGWTSATQSETHTTTTTLYNGTEGAAFNPGGPFQSGWVTLAQPAGLRKQMDGPRTDVTDVITFVYYPIDTSVTATWRGRLAAVSDALGHITTYSDYDVFGNAMKVIDPNGVVVNTTYDGLGRLLTTKYPAISGCDTTADPTCNVDIINSHSYSPGGGPLATETKPRGGVTSYTYDSRGRVASITRAISSTVSERIEYEYDTATGQKSTERLLDNSTGAFVVRKSDDYTYDSQGHLTQVQHPDAAKVVYTYDVAGALATIQDENHAAANTFYAYNEAGALASVSQTLGVGQITTSYAYDAQGNLVSVTDPNGNVTTYAYDDFGRMSTQVSPVTGTTRYGYDLAGNLLTTTDANGATTTRTYDVLSRVAAATSARSGSSSESVTYSYDDSYVPGYNIGRFTAANDPTGVTIVRYDHRGLLRQLQQLVGGVSFYLTLFTYDADGNRSTITYPSGRVVSYMYDLAGRPLSVATGGTTFASSAAYLPFGPLTTFAYANGTTRTMQYDSRYRVTENSLTGTTGTLADYTYAEDPTGNITSIHDATDARYNRDFTYDDLNRLVTANTGTSLWGTGSYAYDAMGNLTSRSLGTPPVDDGTVLSVPGRHLRANTAVTGQVDTLAFRYNSTTPEISVVSANGIDHTVSYDAAGNETSYFAARAYSPRNLMNSVTDTSAEGPAHSVSFGYDYRGVRVSRTETPTDAGSASRYFFYTPEMQLLASTVDDSNNVWSLSTHHIMSAPLLMNREIIWFNGQPVGEFGPPRTLDDDTTIFTRHRTFDTNTPASTLFYTFTDHLGTPLLQTDSTTAIVWRAEHEPYGNVYLMRKGSRADQPLRLPGQETEMAWEGSEENYNVFRWYRAGWGRYTQADPLGTKSDTDVYRYTYNQPTTSVDRLGLTSWHCDISLLQFSKAIIGITKLQATCTSECHNGFQVWADLSAVLVGLSAGVPVGFTPQLTIDLIDSSSQPDWHVFTGSSSIHDLGVGWGGGWGHYEIKLGGAKGQTPGKDSGLASGGGPGDQSYGAGFDVLGAPSTSVDNHGKWCCK
jgi:RHS repeat-associated protein